MLEQLAREYRLTDQITFLGNRSNAARYIRSHRLYDHAATMASFGIVLIEALAADEPQEAARRLSDLLELPERRDLMARAARQRYLAAYTPDIAAARLIEFLHEVPFAKDIAV